MEVHGHAASIDNINNGGAGAGESGSNRQCPALVQIRRLKTKFFLTVHYSLPHQRQTVLGKLQVDSSGGEKW